MKRSLWALPVCAIAVGALVLSAGAQRSGKGGAGGGFPVGGNQPAPVAPAVEQPFTLGNYTWPSKKDFILSGARCGTPTPSLANVLAVEQAIATGIKPKPGAAGRGRGFRSVAAIVTIPVYVHIITDSQGNGDISDSDVQAQIDFLNTSFAGLDTKGPGYRNSAQQSADVPYRFALQGVQRVANDSWFNLFDDRPMKAALRVGGPETLNIYSADLGGGLLGYAVFPDWYQSDPIGDGVVMNYGAWLNGPFTGYNLGDTLTHEVGHWLGLYHTFQGPGFLSGCVRPGDNVSDTPAEAFPYFGSPDWAGYPDTCTIRRKDAPWTASPGRDPIENFMDYSDDIVMYQFTQGQANRMQNLGRIFRNL